MQVEIVKMLNESQIIILLQQRDYFGLSNNIIYYGLPENKHSFILAQIVVLTNWTVYPPHRKICLQKTVIVITALRLQINGILSLLFKNRGI